MIGSSGCSGSRDRPQRKERVEFMRGGGFELQVVLEGVVIRKWWEKLIKAPVLKEPKRIEGDRPTQGSVPVVSSIIVSIQEWVGHNDTSRSSVTRKPHSLY